MSSGQEFRAGDFIAELESSEEFRSLYEQDPQAALERFGLSISDEEACAIRAVNAAGTTVGLVDHRTFAAPINIPVTPPEQR